MVNLGLQRIYGENVMRRIKGCEFHYKQSVEKRARKIDSPERENFIYLANEMLRSTSKNAYELARDEMQQFVDIHIEVNHLLPHSRTLKSN